MIYVSADSHFGHRRISELVGRPFQDVSAMDEALITAWNGVVGPSDTVYHLGDFTLGSHKAAYGYFRRLNGRISVVPGGHDDGWVRWRGEYRSKNAFPVSILPPLYTLKVEGVVIVLCHWAMRRWHLSHHGSCHLYGHSHGRLSPVEHCMDVGVDAIEGYRPISLAEVLERLS